MIKALISLLIQLYLSSLYIRIMVAIVILIIVVLLLIFIIYQNRKKEVKVMRRHLNERELKVFNTLSKKGGKCYQSTLSFLLQMPKSSLSELLNDLESRHIIKKTSKGNKNIISIK